MFGVLAARVITATWPSSPAPGTFLLVAAGLIVKLARFPATGGALAMGVVV